MLDMGFIPDIERICKLVPFTRQTLFFTATMPTEIRRITDTFLHNPERIEVSKPASTAVTVTQSQVPAGRESYDKRATLRALLKDAVDLKNAIIFCNRKREVAILHKSLQKHGFSVCCLHGDMEQSARTAALDQFRKGELPLLVASDVAARGLDIPEVSHVFNFDVPHHPDDYVHRIGRTGRAGRLGTAISLVSPSDAKSIQAIEKLIGQPIPHAVSSHVISEEAAGDDSSRRESSRGGREGRDGRKPRRDSGRGRNGRGPPPGHELREPSASTEAFVATVSADAAPTPDRAPVQARAPRPEREPRQDREVGNVREPREQREPRQDRGPRGPRPERGPRPAAASRSDQPAQQPPSIGRAAAPKPARDHNSDSEPADHSHLPAFLLRPVRARV
jgi:superfamily II DNA/RNA helicase